MIHFQDFQNIEKYNHLGVPGYDGYAKVSVVPEQRRPLHLGAHPQPVQLLLLLLVLVLVLILVLLLLVLVLVLLLALGLLTVTLPANSSLTSTLTHFSSSLFHSFHLIDAIIPQTQRLTPEIKLGPLLKVKMLNELCDCSQRKTVAVVSVAREIPHL